MTTTIYTSARNSDPRTWEVIGIGRYGKVIIVDDRSVQVGVADDADDAEEIILQHVREATERDPRVRQGMGMAPLCRADGEPS